jgi:S-adenosyl methyltransferase
VRSPTMCSRPRRIPVPWHWRTGSSSAAWWDPLAILTHPAAQRTLDFGQPVALTLFSVLHLLREEDKPAEIIAFTGLELIPPGVVLISEWRDGGDAPRPGPHEVNYYGGVALKP